jgi:uncharacterized protein YkwD
MVPRIAKAAVLVVSCAACVRGHSGADPDTAAVTPKASPTGFAASESALPPPKTASEERPPAGTMLTIAQARKYMVKLINRDRATAGLSPVELDDGPPTRAGQAHAEDMARNGYLGHWGTDGSVPEQRLTDSGGADMVLENSSCFTDEKTRSLDRSPRIDPRNVEQAEDMFFHEQPPHDGHRKNILKPWHKKVGIGIAQPVSTPTEIPVPCFAQEFIDPYGTYASVPRKARVGDGLHVQGTVASPATFAGVGLARVDGPKAVDVSELNRRRSYPVPTPYQMYWPPGFQTPIPVKVTGSRFEVDIPLSDKGAPGMYELSVWASFPGSQDLVMIGLRTIQVR